MSERKKVKLIKGRIKKGNKEGKKECINQQMKERRKKELEEE